MSMDISLQKIIASISMYRSLLGATGSAVGDADVHLVVLGSCVGCSRCRFHAFQLGMKHLRVPFARFVYPPVTNVSLDPIII
jgi:hypothetical protein